MLRPSPSARPDPHAEITALILADLEAGVRPWTRPWSTAGAVSRPLRHDGRPYHGVNVLALWAQAGRRGYSRPYWMTFRQALALGGAVRKGERGVSVVYAATLARPGDADTDVARGADRADDTPLSGRFLKRYTVFNIDQIDGLEDRYPGPIERPAVERIAAADAWLAATGAEVCTGGDVACYRPDADTVHMPHIEAFADTEAYYAVLAHELVHWTGHRDRLDRDLSLGRFGDEAYAREELVAELGAAFVCADLGLTLEPRPDHARYIASWLRVLRGDTRFIAAAAAHAERAATLLASLQPPP
ncbi:zincin-like metallopeptidase domain-containing protein [uncultured Brevundimonas sp.]|uniref:ArdC family protein n=1 Tax=uncultured Brevundimonas sp. TaxID=213418 RepID=UPI00259ABA34|nr:zincin-like metallopeptidase domain-containing protein [uncultured Brevundimonas sp.]